MTCAQICAAFDPPIKFGSHSSMVGSRKGYQAEHIIPTSSFHKKGRKGPRMPGCSGYSTPSAQTWMAHDGQTAKKEHKILTDQMRKFSQNNGATQKPLSDWLKEYEKGAEKALRDAKPQRKIKDPKHNPDSLRAKAAKCIRNHAADSFAKMRPRVTMATKLRNPWKAPKPKTASTVSARRPSR